MATTLRPQVTDFSRDVVGRYTCNGLDEAQQSANRDTRPDARPFDIIVVGGGTFGCVLAQHLFNLDKAHQHRILVLEGGPMVLPEHIQNLPLPGMSVPPATSIADLRATGEDQSPRQEVWGLAWHANAKFPGLAYCVGGRSLFWGGWSPRPLDAEMPRSRWPKAVVTDLSEMYFHPASQQLGVSETNDFIHGPLHDGLRKRLFDGLTGGRVRGAISLDRLPSHLDQVPPGAKNLFKLEAPLAVQSRTRAGFFPFNKFSAVPLLIKAAREAYGESGGDNVKKRLMIVPRCHVKRLVLSGGRVAGIETSLGNLPVPAGGAVIVALATIESTRLALLSFEGMPGYDLVGRNLMAHLRSNLTIRIPRASLPIDPAIKDLQASALFVKGFHRHADGTVGHFHLQITAAGLGAMGTDSEAELFRKVPDIDGLEQFRAATDTHVVVTIRGIGEMEPGNPDGRVTLDPEPDEYGVRRAFVRLIPTAKDLVLWDTMDKAAEDVAKVFAGTQPLEVLSKARDGLGTTHHETGTLWMGDAPEESVTNADGRFHHVDNAYVAGPALFPTIGSPNPMLTGVALARRLAHRLVPDPVPYAPGDGFEPLFDGFTTDRWRMAGRGGFAVVDGALESVPGDDLGLYWCTMPTPASYVLKLEWLRWRHEDNSGVFVRFPDPEKRGYANTAYVAVHLGFEIQIDELGSPDGANFHRTGAIYGEADQVLEPRRANPAGQWNEFEIRIQGQTYTVLLNGAQVARFQNAQANRGLPGTASVPAFIGLQSYPGKRVAFRNIRIRGL